MSGMHCDHCGRYRLYWRPAVTVASVGGRIVATIDPESTPERSPLPERAGRFHVDCYERRRAADDRLPAAA